MCKTTHKTISLSLQPRVLNERLLASKVRGEMCEREHTQFIKKNISASLLQFLAIQTRLGYNIFNAAGLKISTLVV